MNGPWNEKVFLSQSAGNKIFDPASTNDNAFLLPSSLFGFCKKAHTQQHTHHTTTPTHTHTHTHRFNLDAVEENNEGFELDRTLINSF